MDAAAKLRAKRLKTSGSSSSRCPVLLPEEIVEDILLRLPAKSLCRFRCVSRCFAAVISSPSFQDAYYRRNSSDRRLFMRPPGAQEPFYAWHPTAGVGVETIMSARRLPQGSTFPVGKSCRGLVLLKNTDYRAHYVWNPSTGEMLALPEKTPDSCVSYGLGYCSATQRHKVVRMYDDACGRRDEYCTVCEVFTLNESAYWRPAATKPPPPLDRERYSRKESGAVFCDGYLHFVDNHGRITSFNVKDETFGTLIIDPPPELQCWSNFELAELGGSLCLYSIVGTEWSRRRRRRDCHVDVWLLTRENTAAAGAAAAKWERLSYWKVPDDEVEQQMQHAMLNLPPWIAPLDMYYDGDDGSSNNRLQRKILLLGSVSCRVFVVDPETGTTKLAFSPKDTSIGERRHGGLAPAAMGLFEESLARVGRLNENTAFASPWMRAWSEVLSRLPAHTVWSELGLVCRGWRAMIKSEHFTIAHLHRANLNKSPQIMFMDGTLFGFEPLEKYINTPIKTPPLIDSRRTIVCSKPCHGLNTWSLAGRDFVCNPAIRYVKALPPSDIVDAPFFATMPRMNRGYKEEEDAMMFAGRLGLGYEQESSRHVLVRVTYKEMNLTTTQDYKMVCHIKYLKDLVWDELDPPPRPIANMPPAHVNGKIYWMVDDELGEQRSYPGPEIVVLDVSTRRFEVLQGPPACGSGDGHNADEPMSIIELGGMVCVTCSHRSMGIIKTWAMNQDTCMWSFRYNIKLGKFSPDYSPETTMPLAIDPKDGRILLSTGRALGYYNPKTAELETIYRAGKDTQGMKFVPILFQESLVNPCHSSV
ncbi:hypothetical protein BS78_01G196000 [Paspalum vaginatum]|nr:hypothetical protein BS78_01G196000 [Paspalum vaginatum]